MKIRKFIAADMQEAVAQVKRQMGADAMIVATRRVRRGLLGQGVEVTAAVDVDDAANDAGDEPAPPPAPRAPAPGLTDADVERVILPLRSELRTLRALLRPVDGTPDDALRGELAAIRRAITELRPQPSSEPLPSLTETAARAAIAAPSQKRVVALVGPTGVGKTTTIAKLAARAALVEHRAVGIITLDNYRVGGEEQMRTFADLIGVPLVPVTDLARTRAAVESFADRDRVFIDTAGRSPRDIAAVNALTSALSDVDDLEVHLALAAGSPAGLVDGWAQRYRPLGVDRLLFTKVDEALDLADVVRAPARLGCPVAWIATGQRVPEDLEDATRERLLELAAAGFAGVEVAA